VSETAGNVAEIRRRAQKVVRLAWICAAAAVVLAVILLVRTTDYMFVFFMFVGAPLVAVAAIALGWVILQDLKHRKVL
jgi:hypothetical protein